VSNYQYGKQDTADWLGGGPAGITHAQRGWQLHTAAGGRSARRSTCRSTPTLLDQYKELVAPYLKSWSRCLVTSGWVCMATPRPSIGRCRTASVRGFWQHNWGSPAGYTHPAAHLHQVEIDSRTVAGVGVDVNEILQPQFGQWD